jgi:hypothetical protein
MENRSLVTVFLLTFVTFGIYGIYWHVKTKGEMNARGAEIPTAWLLIVPFVNIWWLWKYCEGVEHVTGGKLSTVTAFLVLWLLGFIGMLIAQDAFNKVQGAPAAAAPQAPQAPQTPVGTPPTPVV